MGRRRFKAFIPETPPEDWVMPANANTGAGFDFKWETPPIMDVPLTADDIKLDQAAKQITYSTDRWLTLEDHFVGVDTSAQAITITLPHSSTITSGKQLVIMAPVGISINIDLTEHISSF